MSPQPYPRLPLAYHPTKVSPPLSSASRNFVARFHLTFRTRLPQKLTSNSARLLDRSANGLPRSFSLISAPAFGFTTPKGTVTTAAKAFAQLFFALSLDTTPSPVVALPPQHSLASALQDSRAVLLELTAPSPDSALNLELPHRTSLAVLPLPEEESRRVGPVSHDCDTFRPP